MNEFVPSALYRGIHFLHLGLVLVWVAAAVTSDVHVRNAVDAPNPSDRSRSFASARRLTLFFEMPALGALLFIGIMLAFINGSVLKQGWFHAKLLLAVLLIVFFVLTSMRQRAIGGRLSNAQMEGLAKAYGGYRAMRSLMAAATLGIVFVVTVLR